MKIVFYERVFYERGLFRMVCYEQVCFEREPCRYTFERKSHAVWFAAEK